MLIVAAEEISQTVGDAEVSYFLVTAAFSDEYTCSEFLNLSPSMYPYKYFKLISCGQIYNYNHTI